MRATLGLPALLLAAAAALALLASGAQAAQVASETITSTGPIVRITIGVELGCQYAFDDDAWVFFPSEREPADCGTFLVPGPGTVMYGPDFTNHCLLSGGTCGSTPAESRVQLIPPYAPFTPVSQSAVTGTGTSADPLLLTTVVEGGGLRLTQMDTYVEGELAVTTTYTLDNLDSVPHTYRLYRAGDCHHPDLFNPLDHTYGWVPPWGIACTRYPGNSPPSDYVAFTSNGPYRYMQGDYKDVWDQLATHLDLPNTCVCTSKVDAAMAIQWSGTLQPNGQAVIESRLSMVPPPPEPIAPEVTIAIDPGQPDCLSSALGFQAIIVDPDSSTALVQWTLGDGTTSQEFAFKHEYATPGTYAVTVQVTDSTGLSGTASATATSVGNTDCCPTLRPLPELTAIEGQAVRFFAVTDDPEGGAIQYEATGLPPGAMFDATAGYFFWKTGPGAAGDHTFTVTASDGQPHTEPCAVQRTALLHIRPAPLGGDAQDTDLDGIDDYADNCPGVPNHDQEDVDTDGIGDACQLIPGEASDPGRPRLPPNVPDRDGDGLEDALDNCPGIPNSNQADLDLDRLGDLCDADLDGDGVVQLRLAKGSLVDNCPRTPNPGQEDAGATGTGDACRSLALASPVARQAGEAGTGDRVGPDVSVAWLMLVAFLAGALALGAVLVVTRRPRQP